MRVLIGLLGVSRLVGAASTFAARTAKDKLTLESRVDGACLRLNSFYQ